MEIKINKEIRHYQESVILGLSTRQLLCSALAIGIAVGLYFMLKDVVGRETISWGCIFAAIPFGAAGFFKYNGMTIEKFLQSFLHVYLNSGIRVFKSENYYLDALQQIERRKKRDKRTKKQLA